MLSLLFVCALYPKPEMVYHRPLTKPEFYHALTLATKDKPLSKSARLCVYRIAKAESGLDNLNRNPHSTAYGIGQILRGQRKSLGEQRMLREKQWKRGDHPVHQLRLMVAYIKDHYHTPQKALAFWRAHRWY